MTFTYDVRGNVLNLPGKITRNGGTLVKYSYLADGSKASALNGNGEGLVYRGSLIYRRASDGTLSLESAAFAEGMLTPAGVHYHVTDHLGSVRAVVDEEGKKIRIFYEENGHTVSFLYSGTETVIPDNEYVHAVIEAYKYNKDKWRKAGFADTSPSTELVESKDFIIGVYQNKSFDSKYYRDNGGIQYIIWNQWEGTVTDNGRVLSPATILSHEADHAIDDYRNAIMHSERKRHLMEDYNNQEEYRVITGSEQLAAKANGEIGSNEVTRYNHNGKTVYTTGPTSNIIDVVATRYFYKHHYKNRRIW